MMGMIQGSSFVAATNKLWVSNSMIDTNTLVTQVNCTTVFRSDVFNI